MSEPPQCCAYSTSGGHTGPDGVGTDQMQVDPALLQQDVSALRAEYRELMAAIAHNRHDVSSLRGETREAFKVTFRNHHSLDERQSASEGQLKELASRPSPDSASSSPRTPHSGGGAHRRKGGSGTKKLRRANDAFRLLLRRALQISEQEPYPFYPLASKKLPSPEDPFVSTPKHLTGNNMSGNADKPLRPDWEVLKHASVLTLRFVDPFVDKILDQRDQWKISPDKGWADVQEACIGSLDKIRYEVRDRAKKGDESYNDKKRKRKSKISSRRRERRRERRKERARARFVEFMRRTEEALEREWNDNDDDDDSQHEVDLHVGREAKRYLFVVDAMSEDETDEEASRNGLGSVGKVKIPCWRLQEANDAIAKVDETLTRPRASRQLRRPDFRAPLEGVEPLPPSIHRWMVSGTFADLHPHLVGEVQPNGYPFGHFDPDTWGHEPTMPIRPND